MSVQPRAGVGDSAASLQGSAGCWMQERRQEGLEEVNFNTNPVLHICTRYHISSS